MEMLKCLIKYVSKGGSPLDVFCDDHMKIYGYTHAVGKQRSSMRSSRTQQKVEGSTFTKLMTIVRLSTNRILPYANSKWLL